MKNLQISFQGVELIARHEGLRLKAYSDPVGLLTIGYGHLLTELEKQSGSIFIDGVKTNWKKHLTLLEAKNLLKQDCQHAVNAVNKLIEVKLEQHEFDALVSFTFNVGSGALQKSTLRRLLNLGQKIQAANELDRWCKAGGRVLKGLVTRRAEEKSIFLYGYDKK